MCKYNVNWKDSKPLKTVLTRNCIEAIQECKRSVYDDPENTTDEDEYYRTYDIVAQSVYRNTITQLEAQEAFLRDVEVPLVIFVCCILFGNNFCISLSTKICCFWKIVILVLLLFLFFIARYQTQMKIFHAIWENNKIISERNKD